MRLALAFVNPLAAAALALALGGCNAGTPDGSAALIGVAHAETASGPGAAPLHEDGAPKPGTLQAFMVNEVKANMAKGDMAKVKEALKKLPAWVPDPTWNDGDKGWKAIVETATKPDGNLGKACKGCHDTWQKAYKEKFHDRDLPK